jgi:hypothetical protein
MKHEYSKPCLEVLGELRELTAATGGFHVVDVPQGTPIQPGHPITS